MEREALNVAEAYPLYDTINICKTMYGKEKSVGGWFTTFKDFAANEKHTFYKSRTIGNSNLAYCNLDSADNVDFVFTAFSLGVRFFAPVSPDGVNSSLESPSFMNENMIPFWLFDMPKHCGIDFRVQQDVIVENTCLATPPGYGPRLGGGSQPAEMESTIDPPNTTPWKVITGTNGEPMIDNRFPFPSPLKIPRNSTIEANIYPSMFARHVLSQCEGPLDWVLLTEGQTTQPQGVLDYFTTPTRFGIQVSLYGYREVQQRGQYHAAGALQRG